MSLESSYELSMDPRFRGKVLAAISRLAVKVIAEKSNDNHVAFAREVLRNIHHFAERLYSVVAVQKGIDSASSDDAIERATLDSIIALAGD